MDNSIASVGIVLCGGAVALMVLSLLAVRVLSWSARRDAETRSTVSINRHSDIVQWSEPVDEPRIISHEWQRTRTPRGELMRSISQRAQVERLLKPYEQQ